MWCEEADTVADIDDSDDGDDGDGLVTCGSKLPPTALWDLGDDLDDP